MIALWAEADLIVADEFRDGNVPARQEPLRCARMAFEALPDTVGERYFRGDSACYETDLLRWLSSEERQAEPGGRIGFAVSATMSPELAKACRAVAEQKWVTFDEEPDGSKRQCAEVDFVPSQRYEHKHSQPLRYVGLRILKPQGSLFADGSDRHYHAVATNLDWDAARLLEWHREKAGTVEHVHDELKNALAGGHMPSQRFAVNAAWLKLSILSYNIASAIRGLCVNATSNRLCRNPRALVSVVAVSMASHSAGRHATRRTTLVIRSCHCWSQSVTTCLHGRLATAAHNLTSPVSPEIRSRNLVPKPSWRRRRAYARIGVTMRT